ncbi:MAG: hemerythrin domain-containing protein [Sandaracinaceae bacterium]|jgi:hemerythrin-like domain-containing protein|nr:hemerythrin domain-containing protein [Sandaracinaceae bacterium]
MTNAPLPNPVDLREALSSEHRELEKKMQFILDCVQRGDAEDMRESWAAFADTLREHLDEEERDMLPVFEQLNPALALHIRADHAKIRAGLDERAIEIELHTVRANKTAEFIALLREHAAREDGTLYAWAKDPSNLGLVRRTRARLGLDTDAAPHTP